MRSWGAGAAGLYAALCAVRDGATGRADLGHAPGTDSLLLGARAASLQRSPRTTSFEHTWWPTPSARRTLALVRRSAAERSSCARRPPASITTCRRWGSASTATASEDSRRSAWRGGHTVRRVVHAGGSATGRRVVRQLSALVAAEPRIAVLEGARARALWTDRDPTQPDPTNSPSHPRCRGLICDDGRIVTAPAVILGTGGAAALWARTTKPNSRLSGGGPAARPRRRRSGALADLRAAAVPPPPP